MFLTKDVQGGYWMVPSPSYHLKILMTVTLADWNSFYTRDTLKAVYI